MKVRVTGKITIEYRTGGMGDFSLNAPQEPTERLP